VNFPMKFMVDLSSSFRGNYGDSPWEIHFRNTRRDDIEIHPN
jgi:hypothetical protein